MSVRMRVLIKKVKDNCKALIAPVIWALFQE